jgi:hypothetical protein
LITRISPVAVAVPFGAVGPSNERSIVIWRLSPAEKRGSNAI